MPYDLRPKVEAEIDRLCEAGIISPVKFSEWATPIVPVVKKNGDVRICGDFKVTINPALCAEKYPIPRIEDLFASLSGGQHFSKTYPMPTCKWLWRKNLENSSQSLRPRVCSAITGLLLGLHHHQLFSSEPWIRSSRACQTSTATWTIF